jgi:hypothetical protein
MLEILWTKVGLKVLFKFPVFEKILLVYVEYTSHFHKKCHNRDI